MSVPTTNIWESLLKESSKRVHLPDGAVLFFGGAGCGKTSLVNKLCEDSNGPAEADVPKIPDVTAYDSFVANDTDDAVSDAFSTSRVGVWSLSEKSFKGAPGLVLNPSRIEKLVVAIGVDLSKPTECRKTLLKWLQFIRYQLDNHFFSAMTQSQAAAKKSDTLAYLGNVRTQASMEDFGALLVNLGVPLVVVGCKADCLSVNDLAELRKNEDAQRELRDICLKVGAGLIYTSATAGTNCNVLKKYIVHRLYHEQIPMNLSIEHSSSDLFVPAGLDTDVLITGISDSAARALENLTAADLSATEDIDLTVVHKVGSDGNLAATTEEQPTVLEDEQGWLTTLHTEIEQAAAAQSVPNLTQSAGAASFDAATIMAAGASDKPMSAADKILAAGADPTGGETKPIKPSRRNSTMSNTAAKKQAAPDDVKGFFESLMK